MRLPSNPAHSVPYQNALSPTIIIMNVPKLFDTTAHHFPRRALFAALLIQSNGVTGGHVRIAERGGACHVQRCTQLMTTVTHLPGLGNQNKFRGILFYPQHVVLASTQSHRLSVLAVSECTQTSSSTLIEKSGQFNEEAHALSCIATLRPGHPPNPHRQSRETLANFLDVLLIGARSNNRSQDGQSHQRCPGKRQCLRAKQEAPGAGGRVSVEVCLRNTHSTWYDGNRAAVTARFLCPKKQS
jgi:hypothetical protein